MRGMIEATWQGSGWRSETAKKKIENFERTASGKNIERLKL